MKKGKIKKLIFSSIFISFGLFLMLIIGAFFYLTQNADILLKKYQSAITKKTGIEFVIKKIEISVFPLPAIISSQAIIKKDNLSVEVGWMYFRPSLFELCKGNFVPVQITLLRPRVNLNVALPETDNLKDFFSSFSAEKKISSTTWPLLLSTIFTKDCLIEIVQGEALFGDNSSRQLLIAGLECALTLNSEKLYGSINCVSINLRDAGISRSSLERLTLNGQYEFSKPFDNTKLHLRTYYIVPGLINRAWCDMDFSAMGYGWKAKIDTRGNMEFPDILVPWGITGEVFHKFDTALILLKNINLFMDADNGNLDGELRLPGPINKVEFIGSLNIPRISLTQWFGFARNLMPGLAYALDNVTDTLLKFKLTEKNLEVPEIYACSSGFCFSGKGGIDNFEKPNIFLDLVTNFINLEKAIPESMGTFPLAPAFFHPTLTPMPGAPLLPGETGINYNINLSAKNVRYGSLKIANGKVQIIQGKMDTNGLEDVLLKFSGDSYGGKLKGLCILGGAAELPMAISGSLNNMRADKIIKDFPELPFRGGLINSSGEIKGTGKHLGPFLKSLKGTISFSCQQPVLVSEGNSFPLNSLNIKTSIRKGLFQQNLLGLESAWQISCSAQNFGVKGSSDGFIWFGISSEKINFKNMPFKLDFELGEKIAGLKNGLKLGCSGIASLSNKKLDCSNASIIAPDMKFSGSFTLPNYKNFAGQGKFKFSCANVTNCINKYLGKKFSLPPSLQTFQLESRYIFKNKSLSLSDITGKLGSINISGKIDLDGQQSFPVSNFNLTVDKLVFGHKGASKKSSPIKNWDFSSLRDKTTTGLLSVGEITVYGLKFKRCSIPVSLKRGKLKASPCKAIFYGANMHLDGELDVNIVPKLSGKLEVLSFNLDQVMRDQKINSRITGYADFTANMNAIIKADAQMMNCLEGAWTFKLKDGSWQKLGKEGKPEGKLTQIGLAKASGSLQKGIIKSGNFFMQNSSMKIEGGGWINLKNNEVSGNFEVNMKGLPNFPLKISGTLDKPNTSIGTGKMILNLLSGITGGVLDLFAGLGNGILNLFN